MNAAEDPAAPGDALAATLIHEAGHAVMAAIHGLEIIQVHVFTAPHDCPFTGERVSGRVRHVPVYPGPGVLSRIDDQALAERIALREIRVMTAGMLAEAIALRASLAEEVERGSSVDWNNALGIARDFRKDEADQVALVRRGATEAIKILRAPAVWAAVQDLAEHLREVGEADGAAVKGIVSRHVRHGLKIPL